jgi:hypothetical protein
MVKISRPFFLINGASSTPTSGLTSLKVEETMINKTKRISQIPTKGIKNVYEL